MTQENKELLLKDLCARLPYGVKVNVGEDMAFTLKEINENGLCEASSKSRMTCYTKLPLPYLRPMSSMTEEEVKEYDSFFNIDYGYMDASKVFDVADWVNVNHFDYRGLIEKGLAIEVTEESNPYKNDI